MRCEDNITAVTITSGQSEMKSSTDHSEHNIEGRMPGGKGARSDGNLSYGRIIKDHDGIEDNSRTCQHSCNSGADIFDGHIYFWCIFAFGAHKNN